MIASFIPYPHDSGGRLRTREIASRFGRTHEALFSFHLRSEGEMARAEAVPQQGFEIVAGQWGVTLAGRVEDLTLRYCGCNLAMVPLRADGGTGLNRTAETLR